MYSIPLIGYPCIRFILPIMILKKCLLIVQNSFFFRWKYNFVWKEMCIPLNFHLDNVNVHRRCVELICLNSDSVKCRILGNGRLLVCSTCIQLFLNQYFVSSSVYSIRLGIYAYIDIIIRVLQINSYWTIRTLVFLCVLTINALDDKFLLW